MSSPPNIDLQFSGKKNEIISTLDNRFFESDFNSERESLLKSLPTRDPFF